MKQSIVANSEMMANCTIRVIIYLFIVVYHYIKGLSKLTLIWNEFASFEFYFFENNESE